MSTLKVNTIDSHSGSTITVDSTADVDIQSATSALSTTTGALKVTGGISTQDNLYVGGNAVITGTMTANGGTITLGDSGTDNVSFGGEVNSDVLPNTNNTFDLGSSSKKWAEVHATTLNGALTGDVTGNVTGNLTGDVTGNTSGSSGSCTGNAATATTLATARTIGLSGDVSGSVSFDGSANATITATIADDSHNHTTANVDGLDSALAAKAPLASPALTGTPTAPTAAANTNNTQVATTAYVQTEITDLIGGAPGALDTLNELAAAINDDSSYASTVTTALGTKVNTTSAQALSSAANALTISGTTITLARGDSTTDTISIPEGYADSDVDAHLSGGTGITYSAGAISVTGDSIGAGQLNVTGNGTTSQFLRADGDGSFTWATPTDTNTTYSAGQGLDLSSTTFSLESDLRGDVSHVGLDSTDYISWTNNSSFHCFVNNAERVRIESDGDMHADGDVIAYSSTISDERLKTGINTVTDALSKVKSIRGVEFTRKDSGKRSAGVIAQEVEKVLPQAINEKKLPLQTGDEETLYKTVEYDALHALLIEAVKELSDKIEKLENK